MTNSSVEKWFGVEKVTKEANIDLKDFFPSITYPRVKGVFRKLGYSEQVAIILGLICTEPDCDPM